jgi:hypothetical protein
MPPTSRHRTSTITFIPNFVKIGQFLQQGKSEYAQTDTENPALRSRAPIPTHLFHPRTNVRSIKIVRNGNTPAENEELIFELMIAICLSDAYTRLPPPHRLFNTFIPVAKHNSMRQCYLNVPNVCPQGCIHINIMCLIILHNSPPSKCNSIHNLCFM